MIYLRFSDDGQHIRKFSREPFEGGVGFVEVGAESGPRCGDEGFPLCNACSVPAHEMTQTPGCGGPLTPSHDRGGR
jgi:hypothetical protein